MQVSKHVGQRIRLYRKQQNLSLAAMARLINRSVSTLSKYESGAILLDIETLADIAAALNVSIFQLVDYPLPEKKVSPVSKGNFFERSDLFYMYQYFRPEKKIYVSVIKIIHLPDAPDIVSIYYDIADPANYTHANYIYHGTIERYDSSTTICAKNIHVSGDVLFIYAKAPFSVSTVAKGLVAGMSSSQRNPCAYKVLLSPNPLPINDELREELLITGKKSIEDCKRFNAFFVF